MKRILGSGEAGRAAHEKARRFPQWESDGLVLDAALTLGSKTIPRSCAAQGSTHAGLISTCAKHNGEDIRQRYFFAINSSTNFATSA
jgi:hypothetical protein